MKNLHWFDSFLFFLNSFCAAALLFSYLLPYIPPKEFALLSVLSLFLPLLIAVNVLFLIYWFVKFKRQLLLPLAVLLLGFNHLTSLYEITSSGDEERFTEDIKVLSYNVRQFNQFKWSEEIDIPESISNLLLDEDPDILAMQEYYHGQNLDFTENFPHKYVNLKEGSAEFGLAIFSKFPIIDKGSLEFPTASNNNAIFADVVVKDDTLRIISTHLQSFEIKPDMNNVERESSKRVFQGMGQTFVKQQYQMESILELVEESPFKMIVMGDFNNTAYSFIYRKLRAAGLNDAFKEKGSGFGRTFNFDYYPLRIDFIMADEDIEVTFYKTIRVPYSDHFPIKTGIRL